ncbi:hypothetical protein ACSBR2_029953 [Camellia fascicularis]
MDEPPLDSYLSVKGMDAIVMLLCCYRTTNVAYNLIASYTFRDLVNFLCDKFVGLTPTNVCLFFKIPRYTNFSLHNDVDMQNMVQLAHSFRLQLVDVVIEVHSGENIVANDDGRCDSPRFQTRGFKRGVGITAMEYDVDLLPNYCPHEEKTFLSAPWANLECGFDFKYLKNDSVRITAVCSLRDSKGCDWFVHARVLDASGFFYIRKWNSEHSCGVAIRTAKNRRLGFEISYRVAWFGVEKARGKFFGTHSTSFDQLRWYSEAIMEHNSGTYINIDCDEYDNRFDRYFISFKACID